LLPEMSKLFIRSIVKPNQTTISSKWYLRFWCLTPKRRTCDPGMRLSIDTQINQLMCKWIWKVIYSTHEGLYSLGVVKFSWILLKFGNYYEVLKWLWRKFISIERYTYKLQYLVFHVYIIIGNIMLGKNNPCFWN
jgi:hypothetical protein